MRRLGVCCTLCCMLAIAVVSAQLSAVYLHRAFILMTAGLTLQHFPSPTYQAKCIKPLCSCAPPSIDLL